MRKTKRRFIRRGRACRRSRRRWSATRLRYTMAKNSFRSTSRKTWSVTNWANSRRLGFSKDIVQPAPKTEPLRRRVRRRQAEAEGRPERAAVGLLLQHRKRVDHGQQSNQQVYPFVTAEGA